MKLAHQGMTLGCQRGLNPSQRALERTERNAKCLKTRMLCRGMSKKRYRFSLDPTYRPFGIAFKKASQRPGPMTDTSKHVLSSLEWRIS